jgi:hypothetical protein
LKIFRREANHVNQAEAGRKLPISGKGTFSGIRYSENKATKLILENVLVAPTMFISIISIEKRAEATFVVEGKS